MCLKQFNILHNSTVLLIVMPTTSIPVTSAAPTEAAACYYYTYSSMIGDYNPNDPE